MRLILFPGGRWLDYFRQFTYLYEIYRILTIFFERPYLTFMYLILLQYIRPLAAIEHYLEAHNTFLEQQVRAGRFILTGRRKPKSGSIIVCRASSRREVEAILAEDPMDKFQLAVYDIIEFEPNTFEMAGTSS